ncbi:aminotransferase class V-fold PLP-dependent enzyme [bacterium]|nr:aminotransferase class V-fold PLP-dependent enzyme [bacterium]
MSQHNPLRNLIIGVDQPITLPDGREVIYANLDNAASTPSLKAAKKACDKLLDIYASIHRGAGYKSQLASEWYDRSREITLDFVNGDPDEHCVVFTTNTTDAINRLARKFPRDNDKSIIISHVEHHANDLPWRDRGRVVRIPVSDRGEIDPADLEKALKNEGKRARLVSLTGASNVVGTLQPIDEFVRISHKYGVLIAIDAAQLAPHKAISMKTADGDSADFLFLSGHKMYAPYGGGALVGRRDFFAASAPSLRGGGAVLVVDHDGVDWMPPPEREEAGSPNVLGSVTLTAAMNRMQEIGFDALDEVELKLTRRLLDELDAIDNVTVYGLTKPEDMDRRVGVVAFNIGDLDHELVATILAHEEGVGVRNGCFCAHPFVMQMIGMSRAQIDLFRNKVIEQGSKHEIPGAVRLSFGLYNTEEELDRTLKVIRDLAEGKRIGNYQRHPEHGFWHHKSGVPDYRNDVKLLIEDILAM